MKTLQFPKGPKFLLPALLMACALTAPAMGTGSPGQTNQEKSAKTAIADKAAAAVEVRYIDDSTMKLAVLDERVELITPYGKLLIPLTAVVKIEFATRLPEDVAKRIEAAVAELGNADFKKRTLASSELAKVGERAYGALVEAAKHGDPEVAKRAEEQLHKLRQAVPAERLEVRAQDVVTTADSKIAGRITATSFKVQTFQFGDQQLKLSDLRTMQPQGAERTDTTEALADPGNLNQFANQIGKTILFRVTGAGGGGMPPPGAPAQFMQGGVWGTGVYTTDSSLALAAVHAGVLRAGQAGTVRVTFVGQVPQFLGSVQNGISSGNYPAWAGYRVSK